MHAPQMQVFDWAHAKVFSTAGAESALRGTHNSANFRQIHGGGSVRRQIFFKARHNQGVALVGENSSFVRYRLRGTTQ